MALAAVACGAACGDRAAHVTLVPLGGACARPVGANLVKVTAYAASGERSKSIALDETLAIADFPADTEQLGGEVLIGGGATGAAGKSAPLAFDALAEGATIPVFMAPPDGFCEVGGLTAPRGQPLVARAGAGDFIHFLATHREARFAARASPLTAFQEIAFYEMFGSEPGR